MKYSKAYYYSFVELVTVMRITLSKMDTFGNGTKCPS